MFLLDSEGNVKDTNCKADNYKNCLLDGEYVTKDIEGNNIRLYLVFDAYFLQGADIREKIFMRNKKDTEEGREKSQDTKKSENF